MLDFHLKKYPLMQLEDKIKLIFQGVIGPNHLNCNKEMIVKRLNAEYESMKDICYNYDLIEDISDKYVRVYLKPYYECFNDFDLLGELFVLSLKEDKDYSLFIDKIKSLINDENKDFIENYLRSNYMISHSDIYKENYFPHYLVISKKYLHLLIVNK